MVKFSNNITYMVEQLINTETKWRRFTIRDGYVLLTQHGIAALAKDAHIIEEFVKYKNDLENKTNNSRNFFASGGNGFVFTLGNYNVVIKEQSNTKTFEPTLRRMDRIDELTSEMNLPWLKVPRHYGIVTSTRLSNEYMFIEKVGDGINIEDLLDYPNIEGYKKEAIERNFSEYISGNGVLKEAFINEVIRLYTKAYELMDKKLGNDSDEVLADWRERNILIDKTEPDHGNPFGLKLWIIDQN